VLKSKPDSKKSLFGVLLVGILVWVAFIFLKILIAIVIGLVLLWVGFIILRMLVVSPPEPPPAGELRKVKLLYRCSLCGTEVRMTTAPNESPEAPRHCMDDMDLLKTEE